MQPIMIVPDKLHEHADRIQSELERDGATYTIRQIQHALWHWLEHAVDALIDDAAWHTTERNGFGRADFERAIREASKPEVLRVSYDGSAYWIAHLAGTLLLATKLCMRCEDVARDLQHVHEVGHEWYGLHVVYLNRERPHDRP